MRIMLRDIAHARSGDKGNTLNLALVAFRKEDYPLLLETVTAERVRQHFGELVSGTVTRYELPRLGALNFVLEGALDGGVTRSLRSDPHGKSLSSGLLAMEIELDGDA